MFNKMLKQLTVWVILINLVGCNLPQAPVNSEATEINSNSQSASESSTSSANDETNLPAFDLSDLYFNNIQTGTWTESQGLIILLNAAIGTNGEAIEISSDTDTLELTGIIQLANQYLETGENETDKVEIRRLLEILLPSQKALDQFAIPEEQALSQTGKMADLKSQDVDCNTLWRTGFAGTPYPCLMFGQRTISGKNYRIYFPLEWRDDPSKLATYQATFDVLEHISNVYSEFGILPNMYIVFRWDLDTADPLGGIASAGDVGQSNEACPIFIRPPAFLLDINSYKQAIAHEMFHCFQIENILLYRPFNYDSTAWFLEGTAEYFSNLAYPEVDYEYRNIQKLNERSLVRPLYNMSYGNFLFFQHMANQSGPEKIIQMMKAMPITGSLQDQLNAIVAYPTLIELYESYARRFLTNQIADTSGIIYPYTPVYAKVNLVTGSQTGELPHNPFVLYREKFIYQTPLLKYQFSTSAPSNEVKIATAPIDFPVWSIPNWTVDTTCSTWEYMTYSIGVGTNINGQLAPYQITTEIVPEGTPCENCLIGTWQLDPASYINYANSLFPRSMNVALAVGWDGDMLMEYSDSGKAQATSNNFTVFYKGSFPDPNGGRPIQSNLEFTFINSGAVNYTADETTITYNGARGTFKAMGTIVLPDGSSSPFTVDPGAFAAGGSANTEKYACKGNYLSITPILPPSVPNMPAPLFFNRFLPPTP